MHHSGGLGDLFSFLHNQCWSSAAIRQSPADLRQLTLGAVDSSSHVVRLIVLDADVRIGIFKNFLTARLGLSNRLRTEQLDTQLWPRRRSARSERTTARNRRGTRGRTTEIRSDQSFCAGHTVKSRNSDASGHVAMHLPVKPVDTFSSAGIMAN